ncbi:MAG: hypothetical protein LBJ63_08930 [Prevotellaceae bacterium]|jgi:hypothetical protein|nr:hypothetical protein [Prevotellaceae bacterium]
MISDNLRHYQIIYETSKGLNDTPVEELYEINKQEEAANVQNNDTNKINDNDETVNEENSNTNEKPVQSQNDMINYFKKLHIHYNIKP